MGVAMGGGISRVAVRVAASAGVGLLAAATFWVCGSVAEAAAVSELAAPLPANAGSNPLVDLESVSCVSVGNCTAVGSYLDDSGEAQGLLLTETSRVWATGAEAPLPRPADSGTAPGVRLESVSCVSAGNCVAVGSYTDMVNHRQGLLLSQVSGTWSVTEATAPANGVGPDQGVALSAVSCASAGYCAAVGTYYDDVGVSQGLLLTETAGAWGTGVEAALPANAGSNPSVYLASVSCAAAGDCTAAGDYTDSSDDFHGLLLTATGGTWANGVDAPLPASAGANPDALVSSVSCASAGNCTAVGTYADGSRDAQGLLLTQVSGSWDTGTEAPVPANAGPNPQAQLSSVSYASAGNCTAVSSYRDSSAQFQGLLLTEAAGIWATGVEAVPPANADSDPDVTVTAVSCASPGSCTVIGDYVDSSGVQQGMLLTQTAGTWAAGVELPAPDGAGSPPNDIMRSVSCSSAGSCAAVGSYSDNAGDTSGLLVSSLGTAATSVAISCAPNPVPAGNPATCAATVTDTSDNPSPPGGQVSFSTDGPGSFTGSGSCQLSPLAGSSSQASCQLDYTQDQPGSADITASYAGDSTHAASTSGLLTQTVNPAAPDAPEDVSATAGNGSATVSWSPPDADGGSPVTSYTVTATDVTNAANGGQAVTGPASPLTVTGMTGGDSYDFTVTATNTAGASPPSTPSNVVTVELPASITSAGSASTGMRQPFSFTVTTTGTPAAALSETGTLPAGVTFTDNGDGTAGLSGSAAAGTNGTYPITITADNGVGDPATQSFTLTVTTAATAPAITSDASDTETFGVPFSFAVMTTGYPAPRLTRSGTLPAGVTFSDNGDGTATIAGTPARSAVGVYTVTLAAKSTAGTATQTFTLTITKAPVIKKIPTTTAHVGTALNLTITTTGYTTPAITESGTLPPGLAFTDNEDGTATISGTPAAGSGGSYTVTISAANQLGTAVQTFILKVDEPPAITSPDAASASTGTAFAFQVTTTGYPAPALSKEGTLPAGITFKASTGTLSGTPKAGTAGTYTIAITATNSSGTDTQNFTLTIT
jgi:hypothetical protein